MATSHCGSHTMTSLVELCCLLLVPASTSGNISPVHPKALTPQHMQKACLLVCVLSAWATHQPVASHSIKVPNRKACRPLPLLCLHRFSEGAIIIPYNATVGRSGSVLITFKSPSSVPPYRIENRTKSVMLMLRQQLDQPTAPRAPSAGTSAGSHSSSVSNAAATVAAAAAAVRAGAVAPAKKESPRCAKRGRQQPAAAVRRAHCTACLETVFTMSILKMHPLSTDIIRQSRLPCRQET